MDRWQDPYFSYDEEIANASDEELVQIIEEADTWDSQALPALHELAWRYDYDWDAMMDADDADLDLGAIEAILVAAVQNPAGNEVHV